MLTVNTPTWNKVDQYYSFGLKANMIIVTKPLIEFTGKSLPVTFQQDVNDLMIEFLEKTRQWFATPLKLESSLRRLRHSWPSLPKPDGFVTLTYTPSCLIISSKEMILEWQLIKTLPSDPYISADFLESTTPRPQSPVLAQGPQGQNQGPQGQTQGPQGQAQGPQGQNQGPQGQAQGPKEQESPLVRTIQIQNTVDSSESLVPVNDLPLSDILEMESESKEKTMEKQRIREARLRVALAKLKAERMAQKYYMRYGEDLENEDSELSSVSDSDEHEEFARR